MGPDKTGGLPILMSFLSSFNLALACLLAAPSWISNYSNLPFGTQRRSGRLNSYLQEIMDTKTSMPGSPTESSLVLRAVNEAVVPVYLIVPLWNSPCGSAGKESTYNVVDLGSIPGLERFPGEGKGYLLQYSGLENSMDCTAHGVAKSWTQLSDFHLAT